MAAALALAGVCVRLVGVDSQEAEATVPGVPACSLRAEVGRPHAAQWPLRGELSAYIADAAKRSMISQAARGHEVLADPEATAKQLRDQLAESAACLEALAYTPPA